MCFQDTYIYFFWLEVFLEKKLGRTITLIPKSRRETWNLTMEYKIGTHNWNTFMTERTTHLLLFTFCFKSSLLSSNFFFSLGKSWIFITIFVHQSITLFVDIKRFLFHSKRRWTTIETNQGFFELRDRRGVEEN